MHVSRIGSLLEDCQVWSRLHFKYSRYCKRSDTFWIGCYICIIGWPLLRYFVRNFRARAPIWCLLMRWFQIWPWKLEFIKIPARPGGPKIWKLRKLWKFIFKNLDFVFGICITWSSTYIKFTDKTLTVNFLEAFNQWNSSPTSLSPVSPLVPSLDAFSF